MATNHDDFDLLRNPAVDYDRTDLSPRGILVFLVGLLVAGIFIELVIWGMFRFLSHSPFFAKGNPESDGECAEGDRHPRWRAWTSRTQQA